MSLPIQKRDFDVFLSHAHKDVAFVSQLDRWLTSGGLRVWYDARELAGGALLATDLQTAIERCRGILLVASDESLDRGWVKAEYNSAMDERATLQENIVRLKAARAKLAQDLRTVLDAQETLLEEIWSASLSEVASKLTKT